MNGEQPPSEVELKLAALENMLYINDSRLQNIEEKATKIKEMSDLLILNNVLLERAIKSETKMFSGCLKKIYNKKFLVYLHKNWGPVYLGEFNCLECSDIPGLVNSDLYSPDTNKSEIYYILEGTVNQVKLELRSIENLTENLLEFDNEDSAKLYTELGE